MTLFFSWVSRGPESGTRRLAPAPTSSLYPQPRPAESCVWACPVHTLNLPKPDRGYEARWLPHGSTPAPALPLRTCTATLTFSPLWPPLALRPSGSDPQDGLCLCPEGARTVALSFVGPRISQGRFQSPFPGPQAVGSQADCTGEILHSPQSAEPGTVHTTPVGARRRRKPGSQGVLDSRGPEGGGHHTGLWFPLRRPVI